jgi:transcriptional regulator with XRE-family HTH domain
MSKTLDKKNQKIIALWKYIFENVKDQGLTLEEFSKKIGQGLSTVQKWKAETPPPNLEQIEAMSNILGIDILKHGYYKDETPETGKLVNVLERLVESKNEEVSDLRNDKKFLHSHIIWLENRFGSDSGNQAQQ